MRRVVAVVGYLYFACVGGKTVVIADFDICFVRRFLSHDGSNRIACGNGKRNGLCYAALFKRYFICVYAEHRGGKRHIVVECDDFTFSVRKLDASDLRAVLCLYRGGKLLSRLNRRVGLYRIVGFRKRRIITAAATRNKRKCSNDYHDKREYYAV